MVRCAARYFDGQVARANDVLIELDEDGITISDPAGVYVTSWPRDRIVLVERPERGRPARLGLADTTARLVVADSAFFAAFSERLPDTRHRVRVNGRKTIRAGLLGVGALASLVAIVALVIPLLSARLAAMTPQDVKGEIGQASLVRITELLARLPGTTGSAAYCVDDRGRALVSVIVDRLDRGGEAPVQVFVIDARLANAFALPGGIVVLTRGLIEQAQSVEEVAGVLAHELGHAAFDHPTRAMYRGAAVSLLVSAVIGDFTGGVLVSAVAEWALNSGYSREAERAADGYAVDRMNDAGIDPRPLADFLRRLMEENSDPEGVFRFVSTHPPSADRIAEIEARAAAPSGRYGRGALAQLKRVCATKTGTPMPAYRNAAAR